MERLTTKREADAQREAYERRIEQGYPRNIPEERFLKLAAYEDTGLTPEEVWHWKECIATPTMKHLVEMCGKIEAERDRYKKAEADGRLAVLPCAPGTEVWAVERDEDGCAVDVSGYMFLAKAGDAVILTAYINDLDNAQDTLAYHMRETARNYETNLVVFPADDCYTTREEAEKALEGMEV